MPDDRDTPRPGRPADLPSDSADDTAEHTPPPQVIPPEPNERARHRRFAASQPPVDATAEDKIRALRATVDDLWQRDLLHTEGLREAQRALDRLWGLRDAHNQVLEVAAELATVKAALEAGPGVVDAERALHEVEKLRLVLFGVDGTNGKIGSISKDAGAGKRAVRWLFGGALGALAGSLALVIATALQDAGDAGELRNQVRANSNLIQIQQQQINALMLRAHGDTTP